MKKSLLLIPISALALAALIGCTKTEPFDLDPSGNVSGGTTHTDIVVDDTGDEPEVSASGAFSLKLGSNVITATDNVYTITEAGEYDAAGVLENGQIIVNAPEDAEVVINLNGASISCSTDSPIKALSADKLEISAKKKTTNLIEDKRNEKGADSDSALGEGAINAKCDLKLKGAGTLVVRGNYNNGVHTTKDLEIQKETLYVTAINNALKGKNSISITSGTVTAISKKGNGLKTDNTDISSKGKQRGNITVEGGTLVVDSAYDAIDAAYNIVVTELVDGETNEVTNPTKITAKTGANSTYSANYDGSTSAKGLKADNQIDISAGSIAIKASDDAIHANYGDAFDNGSTGLGNVNVTGGQIGIASGDDGIHADNTLTISDGIIDITGSSEGIEATHIDIQGGSTCIYGSDDGVNASKKINETPTVKISGGFLDVSVTAGDTDGIDSNGNFEMTGGFVVSRGSPGNARGMSTGLDCDGTAKIAGGTFIAFNGMEKTPSTGTGVLYAKYNVAQGGGGPGGPGGGGRPSAPAGTVSFNAGVYTLTGGDLLKTFENDQTYSNFIIYSSEMSIGTAYTLSRDEMVLLSWTQSKSSTTITL